MSLPHAILGFLNYGPSSGYDLKKAFDASVRHFWPADQSQIYRTLAHMAEQDWVEIEVIRQQDRPDRKVYHITPAGREELRRWLKSALPPEQSRRSLLVQVFFAAQLDDEQVLAIFEREARYLREALQRYTHLPQEGAQYAESVGSPREVFFWCLTLEHGIKRIQAQLEWVESVIHRLKSKVYASFIMEQA